MVDKEKLGTLYDTYGSMIYGIAHTISEKKELAEEIVASTFKKLHHQEKEPDDYCTCAMMIRLTLESAQELRYQGPGLNLFPLTPLLHALLVQQVAIDICAEENGTTRTEILKDVREEFRHIRENMAKQQRV